MTDISNTINIVYVDDNPDEEISKYLKKNYKYHNFQKKYEEIIFNNDIGYEQLINNPLIKEANIILIDSRLFVNSEVSSEKFSGEEFKIILKKIFPFIEVIVISQNDDIEAYDIVSKYRQRNSESSSEYYAKKLKEVLDLSIRNIEIYRKVAEKIKNNKGFDTFLVEKITNSLDGLPQYDELKSEDIDNLIIAFNELRSSINE
jgi:hypothetical protein